MLAAFEGKSLKARNAKKAQNQRDKPALKQHLNRRLGREINCRIQTGWKSDHSGCTRGKTPPGRWRWQGHSPISSLAPGRVEITKNISLENSYQQTCSHKGLGLKFIFWMQPPLPSHTPQVQNGSALVILKYPEADADSLQGTHWYAGFKESQR